MDNFTAQVVLQPQTDAPALAAAETRAGAPDAAPAPEPARPPEPAPKPGDPMIELAYACLRRELASLLEHEPRPGDLPTPENIHQLRIATRRLRVALRSFRHVLPAKNTASLRKELRWFARALGEARDLDVYAENFRSYLQTLPPEQLRDLGGYELHLRRARAEARNDLGALFADERYAALLGSFAAFLDGAPTPAAVRRWRSFKISDGFKKYLRKSARRVQKLGRKVGRTAAAKKLHALRIRTKRLRYELEFFAAVYPSLESTARAAKALQDVLGAHQDACTASSRLRRYARSLPAREHGVPPPAALQQLLELQRRKAQEARLAFGFEWRRFMKTIARTKLAA
ncbi:MAG TPA: CHAD domain-containing protein [Gammaproteobacteria bacterium]|nr:CHAD domain-containing protein [Gammaproteobacteria bacterium]